MAKNIGVGEPVEMTEEERAAQLAAADARRALPAEPGKSLPAWVYVVIGVVAVTVAGVGFYLLQK